MLYQICLRPLERSSGRVVIPEPGLVGLCFRLGWNGVESLLDDASRNAHVDGWVGTEIEGLDRSVTEEVGFEITEDEDAVTFCSGPSSPSKAMNVCPISLGRRVIDSH